MGQMSKDRGTASLDRLRELLGTMLGGDEVENAARVLGLCAALDDADRLGTEIARRMGAEAYYADGYDVGVSLIFGMADVSGEVSDDA